MLHREAREDIAVFRHIANTALGNLKRLAALDGPALPPHLALAIDQPHDGLCGGGAARAIAPEQGHDLARGDLQVHAVQHMAFTIKRVQAFDV